MIFDVLELEGVSTMALRHAERRALLDSLELGSGPWAVGPVSEDGAALFAVVVEEGLEGIVCKQRSQTDRPGERGQVKVENRDDWRYPQKLRLCEINRRSLA